MIDMKAFLMLMGTPTHLDRLCEDEKPAFFDKLIIDEQGIKAMPVDTQTFSLLTETEREQVTLNESTSELKFPCNLSELRNWIIANGYKDLVNWANLENENETIKKIAKIKGMRLSLKMNSISISEISSKDFLPAHGNFDVLTELYCWRTIVENELTELSNYRKYDLSATAPLRVKLTEKIQQIDEAIDFPLANLSGLPTNLITKNIRRENELHELIHAVDQHLQQRSEKRPSYKEIWNEIENNHSAHDKLEIIEEITPLEIIWVSPHGNRSRLKYTSFSKALSSIRRKHAQ